MRVLTDDQEEALRIALKTLRHANTKTTETYAARVMDNVATDIKHALRQPRLVDPDGAGMEITLHVDAMIDTSDLLLVYLDDVEITSLLDGHTLSQCEIAAVNARNERLDDQRANRR